MRKWHKTLKTNDNSKEISFFDVKEVYDAAYVEKERARVNLRRFATLLNKAEAMEAAYRAQLTKKRPYAFGRVA